MTVKQDKIVHSALELFSKEGYFSTPTSKIAKYAGVSEGLIFRHYGSKQGLLNVLIKEAGIRLGELLIPILFETNPKKVIRRSIKFPFKTASDKDRDFLRLLAILKWDPKYNKPEKMNPLIHKLTVAFRNLNYKDPENEARLLHHTMNDITNEILKGNMKQAGTFRDFLLKKYKVS
jgi:AcrR family transcriptional regulator